MKPFDQELSLLLDEATYKSEQGSKFWATIKAIIEGIIFNE